MPDPVPGSLTPTYPVTNLFGSQLTVTCADFHSLHGNSSEGDNIVRCKVNAYKTPYWDYGSIQCLCKFFFVISFLYPRQKKHGGIQYLLCPSCRHSIILFFHHSIIRFFCHSIILSILHGFKRNLIQLFYHKSR